jgi:hypothetical protein
VTRVPKNIIFFVPCHILIFFLKKNLPLTLLSKVLSTSLGVSEQVFTGKGEGVYAMVALMISLHGPGSFFAFTQ